jgi:LAO/AO transport system kinase
MAAPKDHEESTTSDGLNWTPPVIATIATQGDGIQELKAAVFKHQSHLQKSGEREIRERSRVVHQLETILRESLLERFLEDDSSKRFDAMVDAVLLRQQSPLEAVAKVLDEA